METIISRNTDIFFHKYYSNNLNSNKEQIALCSGLSSSVMKIISMPFDTVSNIYQIHGKSATNIIKNQYKNETHFFYRGTIAHMTITTIGSTAWLYTYSILQDLDLIFSKNINNAIIGAGASIVSDITVNPIRIIKTYKQSNSKYISYKDILKYIIEKDRDLFKTYFRGFGLRMTLNAFNSSLFVVLWKNIE